MFPFIPEQLKRLMFLRVGDLTIHLRAEGPPGAPALLLLHSLGASQVIWDAQAEALRAGFRVIRPDMRGHGLSTATPGPYDMDMLARDALGVLDALAIGTTHVAGLSIGGLVAQNLALRAPDRVRSLILIDTALAIPPAETWHERARMARTHGMLPLIEGVVGRWVTPGFLHSPEADGLRAMLLRTPPEGYAGASEAIAAADFTRFSSAIRARTLVMVGEHDHATPVSSAMALCDAIPGAQSEILADAAHIPVVEHPNAVLDAMRRFLSDPDSRAAPS